MLRSHPLREGKSEGLPSLVLSLSFSLRPYDYPDVTPGKKKTVCLCVIRSEWAGKGDEIHLIWRAYYLFYFFFVLFCQRWGLRWIDVFFFIFLHIAFIFLFNYFLQFHTVIFFLSQHLRKKWVCRWSGLRPIASGLGSIRRAPQRIFPLRFWNFHCRSCFTETVVTRAMPTTSFAARKNITDGLHQQNKSK